MIPEPYPVLWTGQRAVVVLPDHMDVSNAADIRSELLSVINRGPTTLIADMSATASCDHSGADAVARAYQRAVISGTDLRLVVSSQIVRRVLTVSGIEWLISVHPSLETALAATTSEKRALTPAAHGTVEARVNDRQADRTEPARPRTSDVPAGRAAPAHDVGTEIALLDHEGVIVSVNQAWQTFAAKNQGKASRVGPGMSYLEACAAAGNDPVALEVAAAIRGALAGDLPGPMAIEVPCHSPDTARWFDLLISARMDDDGRHLGATLTLSLARSEPRVTPPAPGDEPEIAPVPAGSERRAARPGRPASEPPAPGEGATALPAPRPAEADAVVGTSMEHLLVHRLFSAGLTLQTAQRMLGDHPASGKISEAIDDLDLAIRELRSFLFDQDAPGARAS